ncbi:MAG: LytTR family DNA-binding domain-containing protein [Acidobacteriota bacterium]
MAIRTILVDDEPLAREKLQGFLQKETDIEIVAECRDGREAVETIERERPDLVFLDVQMPEMDGFEVIETLEADSLPIVVFVTAFDQYALKAFDVHAVDYLLKPFDRERFREALDRARRELGRESLDSMRDQLLALLRDVDQRRPRFPDRLVVKTSGRVVFVRVDTIDWIDAAGNYVKIHAGGEVHTLRETMTHLEERLDPERFLRIHRSTIVRVDRIKELQQQFHGDYVVILEGGQRLTLSRSYRDRIQELLDRSI